MLCYYLDMGLVDYKDSWKTQHDLAELRAEDKIDDILLLLEHPHVITFGKNKTDLNMLKVPLEEIERKGVQIVETNRGGNVTYHGPGQLVGYPIIDFTRRMENVSPDYTVNRYMDELELVMQRAASEYNPGKIVMDKGLWYNGLKLGSTGVYVKSTETKKVTMHGFALDVNTDLSYFDLIYPCGFKDKGVTSLKNILGKELDMRDVKEKIVKHFGDVFGYTMVKANSIADIFK